MHTHTPVVSHHLASVRCAAAPVRVQWTGGAKNRICVCVSCVETQASRMLLAKSLRKANHPGRCGEQEEVRSEDRSEMPAYATP